MSDRTEMLQVFLKSEYDKLERRIKAVEDLHKTEIDQRVVGTKVRYRTLNELEAENQQLKDKAERNSRVMRNFDIENKQLNDKYKLLGYDNSKLKADNMLLKELVEKVDGLMPSGFSELGWQRIKKESGL